MRLYFAVLCVLLVSCVQVEQKIEQPPVVQIENTQPSENTWCLQRVQEQYLPYFNVSFDGLAITKIKCWPEASLRPVQFEIEGTQGKDNLSIYFYTSGGASYALTERCLKINGQLVISNKLFQRTDGYEVEEEPSCKWHTD
ncbi:hypothetical protein J4211_00050 [Candidatus Woesearchaeota archaeon]|nr:hypothetical protein [Candidatus Woesearchaeota archaeon]